MPRGKKFGETVVWSRKGKTVARAQVKQCRQVKQFAVGSMVVLREVMVNPFKGQKDEREAVAASMSYYL